MGRKVVAGNLPGVGALGARFEVRSILGEGPLGVVYRVFDREVEVTVAVKVLRSHLLPGDAERQRFLDVCEKARRLSHPNLVRIFHANADGAYPFYAMQLVEGMSLQQLLSAAPYNPRRFSVAETQVFVEQIVEALGAAHSVVPAHGLLKPENTLLLPDLLKLADFHLGSVIPPSALGQAHERSPSQKYLAPELRAGRSPTPASDVYSLSCIAAELLTGSAPTDPGNELWGIDLAEDVEALLGEGLVEDPARRLDDPAEFLRRFRAFAEQGRWAYSPTGVRSAGSTRRPSGAPPATLPLASSLSSSGPPPSGSTDRWKAPRSAASPTEGRDSILDTLPDDAPASRNAAAPLPAPEPTAPVARVAPVVAAAHADERRRRVPVAVWVLLALLVLGGAVYGVIYYMQQFRQEQREELLRLNAAERRRLSQERGELAKLRSDLLSAERRAAAAAELAQKRAQEALKAAGKDPKKQAEAKRLAARARRLESRRKKVRARRRAIEKKEKDKAQRETALAAKAAKVDEAVAAGAAVVSPKSNGDESAVEKPTLRKPIEVASATETPVAAPTGAGTALPEVEKPVAPPPAAAVPAPTEPEKTPSTGGTSPDVEKPAVTPTETPKPAATPPPEAPKKAWRPRTVFLRQGMARPKRISGRNPAYTSAAKRAGISGTVVVLFTIKPDGSVHKVRVLKKVPVLGTICARTVSRWRFSPYQYQGRPVSVIVRQSFEFKL